MGKTFEDEYPYLTYSDNPESIYEGGITPTGEIAITENDTYDVTEYASAVVNVPNPSTGTLQITANDTYDVTQYANAEVNVPDTGSAMLVGVMNGTATNVIAPDGVTNIRKYLFYSVSALQTIELPDSTISIGENAFYNCLNLTSVKTSKLQTIESVAFSGCKVLRQIGNNEGKLPDLTTINSSAFSGCNALEKFEAPNLTAMYSSAFQNCSAMELFDAGLITRIPSGTTGNSIFSGCHSLTKLILRNNALVYLNGTSHFNNTPLQGYGGLSATVYVPSALIASYQADSTWSSLSNCTFSAIEGSPYELPSS